MKKGLKGVFTASLAVLALGGLVACGGDDTPENNSTSTEESQSENEKVTLQDVTFTGEAFINTVQFDEDGNQKTELKPNQKGEMVEQVVMAPEKYDLELKGTGKDAKFTLTLQSQVSEANGSFKGTYEFFDHVGYTFHFPTENIRTKFDGQTKEHVLYYNARLGDYGAGEVKLTCHDENFTIDETMLFVTNANFGFALTVGRGEDKINTDHGPQAGIGFGLKLFADNKFEFRNNHVEGLNEDGTYTYDKATDTFTLHMKSGDVKSTNNKGVYTLPVKSVIGGKTYNVDLSWNSNYYGGNGLSAVTYPMGSEFATVLTLNNDGTCFLDGSAVNPLSSALAGMNLNTLFDRTGTWTYDEETKQYTIKYTDYDQTGTASQREFTSTYDEETGLYSMKFIIASASGTLTGKNFGKGFTGGQAA